MSSTIKNTAPADRIPIKILQASLDLPKPDTSKAQLTEPAGGIKDPNETLQILTFGSIIVSRQSKEQKKTMFCPL